MLILFDIDGTLLLTQGAGVAALGDAGRELFGAQFSVEGVEFSGRLDRLIWEDLARRNGVAEGEAQHDRFRQAYGRHLGRRLQSNPTSRLLPGVAELIDELDEVAGVTLGLLTGNYPETGRLKIQCAGLDPDVFTIAAWGSEGRCRRDLPAVAMQRHAERSGRRISPGNVVIIGDTPHDIDCAKAHGCRSIGVATGMFSIQALREAGAGLAVPTLGDTPAIVNWLLSPASAPSA